MPDRINRVDAVSGVMAALLAWWSGMPMVIQALVSLTLLDVVSGVGKAIVNNTIWSAIAYRGAVRKSLGFVLIAAGWVAYTKLGIPVPLHLVIAGFFCASELFSIVENCQAAGVKVPEVVIRHFHTYQQEQLNGRTKDSGK